MKLTADEIQEARDHIIQLRDGWNDSDNRRLCNIIIQVLDEQLTITNQDILQDYIKIGNELDRVETKIKFIKEDILEMLNLLMTPSIAELINEEKVAGAMFAYQDCLKKIEDIGDKVNDQ